MVALQALAAANPDNPAIFSALGKGYQALSENRRAVEYFMRAAECESDNSSRSYDFLCAGGCFERLAEYERAIPVLEACIALAGPERVQALNLISGILALQGKQIASNAVAEYSLSEDPTQAHLRFSLGLGYDKQGNKDLYLYHFAILSEQDTTNAAASYNLGIGYQNLKMPILAFANYKHALEAGETLSASAMSYLLMDAGDVGRADELLREALQNTDCDPAVGAALSALGTRKVKEGEKAEEVRRRAENIRPELVRYGAARVFGELPDTSGVWTFPFGELTLMQNGDDITGSGEDEEQDLATELSNLSALANLARCTYVLIGKLRHRSAEVTVSVTRKKVSLVSRDEVTRREGFIVFDQSALSARVTEISDGEVAKSYDIKRKG